MTTDVVNLSRLVKDTELEIVDLEAEDPVGYKSQIERLLGKYHQLIDKLKECGIHYRDKL